MSSTKKSALRFVFTTLSLDIIGASIVGLVLPRFVEQLIDGDISKESQYPP